jgi:KDO2-lipid IV(A) lauroyltransferase
MGGAMTKRFGPTYVIVKKVGSPGMDRFVSEMRTRNRFMTIERKGKGTASEAIKQALARNEIIGFVMDQARPSEPKYAFFGHPAKTNTGFAAIWRKNPAPILSAHCERVGLGRHVIKIHPRIPLSPTEDLAADIETFTNRFNREVEMIVKICPSQYFWMHNRWKK